MIIRSVMQRLKCIEWNHSNKRYTTIGRTTGSNTEKRILEVAIVGAPNAGKSQLLNCMVQSKVSAVSRKRHTTRTDILGVRNIGPVQLVFIDTPGFLTQFSSKKDERMNRELVTRARSSLWSCDYSLVVIDAAKDMTKNRRVENSLNELMYESAKSSGDFAVVLNKVDLVEPKSRLLDLALTVNEMAQVAFNRSLVDISKKKNEDIAMLEERLSEIDEHSHPLFMISALENDGVEDIIKLLVRKAKPGNWVIMEGHTTELSPKERTTEIIREKIYRSVHREVPHNVQLVNRLFQEYMRPFGENDHRKILRIEQDLVVKTKSHARILYGKAGSTLKRIQKAASYELSEALDIPVELYLHIRVVKNQHVSELDGDIDDFSPY